MNDLNKIEKQFGLLSKSSEQLALGAIDGVAYIIEYSPKTEFTKSEIMKIIKDTKTNFKKAFKEMCG